MRPGSKANRGRFRVGSRAMFERAMAANLRQVAKSVSNASFDGANVCDIGCWDAESFMVYAPKQAHLMGIDQNADAVAAACKVGVDALAGNLEEKWPLEDGSVDVVCSNQVIEHMLDTDHFVSEVLRVLRPGGVAVVSTENLASWHNISALAFGWQPFSLANVSTVKAAIGNPLSNLRDGEQLAAGWQHVRVFAYRGLLELFEIHGFVDVKVSGAGYYPLPAWLGAVDPRHAAFITVTASRPESG